MRARRISEGETTQSGVDRMGLALKGDEQVGEATNEPREEGQHLPAEAKRFCKRCESAAENVAVMVSRSGKPIQVAAEQHAIVAHTGTVHLEAGEGMTLCGLETGSIT